MNFDKKYRACAALLAAASMLSSGCALWKTESEPAPVTFEEDDSEYVVVSRPSAPAADVSSLNAREINDEIESLSKETEKLQLEKSVIESSLALADSEQQRELLSLQLEKMKLDAARAERTAKFSAEMAEIEGERTELEGKIALEKSRSAASLGEKRDRLNALELEFRALQAEIKTDSARKLMPVAVAQYREELAQVAPAAAQSPKYLKAPLVAGTLILSYRRVELNGPVTGELAKTVCEKLYFYSNQSAEYPIFIVIDNSPGGSVSAGYQIQKAMKSCRAPVYVVVKGFAASMAAVIATTSERSFCFENTRVLHHQISSNLKGNMTVLREGVAESERWYELCCGPVAEKMGISLEELTKEMYAHNSGGDWSESGARAVELKWIDNLVSRIEETGVISIAETASTDRKPPAAPAGTLEEKTDSQGRRYVDLPVDLRQKQLLPRALIFRIKPRSVPANARVSANFFIKPPDFVF